MRVLIIDDEPGIRRTTAMTVETMGHRAFEAGDSKTALQILDDESIDAAFLDLRLGEEDGLEVLPRLLEKSPGLSVVVFTAYSSVETAVEAIRRGAVDYIAKPCTPGQIRASLARVVEERRLKQEVTELRSTLTSERPGIDASDDPAMKRVFEIVAKAASTEATILLLGESGTGKTVLARAIHEQSPLRGQPFVTVSCPSLSRELLESELFGHRRGAFTGATSDTWGKVAAAEGGTLFLDEIGEMPLEIQPKLLRLLQEREYERIGENKIRHAHVRIMAATNRELEKYVRERRFREDLYYRLNVISLSLPPLRERGGDILPLAEKFLAHFSRQTGKAVRGFTPAARQALASYAWPGNIRELRNVIERAVILCDGDQCGVEDLPETLSDASAPISVDALIGSDLSLEEIEERHIRKVMDRARTLEEAARILGIDPATLYRKRRRWKAAARAS